MSKTFTSIWPINRFRYYQVLPLWARMGPGAMAMKWSFKFRRNCIEHIKTSSSLVFIDSKESPLILLIFLRWFGLVLWHVNHCRIFNAKSIFIHTDLFQTIQVSISTLFSSIWSIVRTVPSTTTPGQNRPGNNGNERVLRIPQSSSISGSWPSDC